MSQTQQRYEYKTIKVDRYSQRKIDKELNKHAAQGWELDRIDRKSVLSFGSKQNAILRRPVG